MGGEGGGKRRINKEFLINSSGAVKEIQYLGKP